MKIKYKDIKTSNDREIIIRRFYESKYYGIWLNAFYFPELSEQQNHYIMKQFWKNGRINAMSLIDTKEMPKIQSIKSVVDYNNGNLLLLTPFTENYYNIFDYPTNITPTNTRGATYIPTDRKVVNEDCVIGYAHKTHMPVRDIIMFYIDRIVDVEMTIGTNLFTQKMPRLVVVSPEDRQRVDQIMTDIENGENKVFLDVDDINAVKNVLDNGGNYVIDKLYQYKQSIENELLTLLGVDNIGLEKRERLIVDEANSNNDLINDYSDCFLKPLQDFCDNVTNVLGYKLSVKATSSPVMAESNQIKEEPNNESIME